MHKHIMWQLTPCPDIKMSCHIFTGKCVGSNCHVKSAGQLKKCIKTSTRQHVNLANTHPDLVLKTSCHVCSYITSQKAKRKFSLQYSEFTPLCCLQHGNSHCVFTKLVATWQACLWQLTRLITKLVAFQCIQFLELLWLPL